MTDLEELIATPVTTPPVPPPASPGAAPMTPRDWDSLPEDAWRNAHDRLFVAPPPLGEVATSLTAPEKVTRVDLSDDPDYKLPTLSERLESASIRMAEAFLKRHGEIA